MVAAPTTIGEKDDEVKMKDFRPAKKLIEVSVGESVRIVRELQDLSQNGLSK